MLRREWPTNTDYLTLHLCEYLVMQVAWSLIWALAVLGAATNAKVTTLTSPTTGHMYNLGQCTTYQVKTHRQMHKTDFPPSSSL